MSTQHAPNDEVRTFFNKLLRALEFGQRKAEKQLVAGLFERFKCPSHMNDPASWLAEHVAPELVMGWLMSEVEPFARMLGELYVWLADLRATVGGNVDEVRFDFLSLNEQVAFPLDSFPKTYVREWADTTALKERFQPNARGRLQVDTPNYWSDDVLALSNLSYSAVLRPYVFKDLPTPNQQAIAWRVRRVVAVLDSEYVRHERPANIKLWQFTNHEVLYVASEADWTRALELASRPGADGGTATSAAASELYDHFDLGIKSGRMVHGDYLAELFEIVERQRLGEIDSPASELVFGPNLEADSTYAFLCAYALCFPASEHPVRVFSDVVDKVLLPFWRHRWRLFEVWSILWMRSVLPERVRPVPCLQERDDAVGLFTWVLAGGDATIPVATASVPGREVSLWFQRKTPLSDLDAQRFKQANIEPDVRLRESTTAGERDLAILELKDRYLSGGSEEKRVARMYATTGAPVVCVANYSPFRAKSLRAQLYREIVGPTTIYLADSFGPGATPEMVARAIHDAAVGLTIDIMLDISFSMDSGLVHQALKVLSAEARSGARWFIWSDGFEEVGDEGAAVTHVVDGPRTDLAQAVEAQQRLGDAHRALILTDLDGFGQFNQLAKRGLVDDGSYLCIDVGTTVDKLALDRWLHQRF